MTQQTFTSSGSVTFPAGVTSVLVQATGEGGNGATSSHGSFAGGGGAGGEFAQDTVAVTPGIPYSFTIGAGGTSTNTVFAGNDITVTAHFGPSGSGASGGTGGTGSTNAVHFNGGNGAASPGSNNAGGGGGGSAGSGSIGGNASGLTGGSAGTGTIPGAAGASGGGALVPGTNGNAPGSGASGGGSGGSINHGGGTGAPGQIVLTYTAAVTVPTQASSQPAITPLDINGARFQRQNPASYPGVYIKGITATDTVVANTGTPVVNRTGLASAVTDRSFFGNVVIQPNYQYPAPFPVSLPYPMNLILGSYRVQPRYNTNIASPTIAFFGTTSNVNATAPSDFSFQVTTPGIFFNQFPFANNIPFPLNIVNRIIPQRQGQPLAYVAEPTINVSAVAPFGTITITDNIVAHDSVQSPFGGIFIQGKVQPAYPFTNFPLPLKLHNLRPQYSSGKIKFPTVIFGLTANELVSAPTGIVEIGKAVPGFVSNNFAASVPGLPLVSVPKNASNVNAVPSSPGAKVTAFGTLSTASQAARFGTILIKEPGLVANVNANPEFGSVHISRSVQGITSAVTASSIAGTPSVKLHVTGNISASASPVLLTVFKSGNTSGDSAASRFGIVKISKSLPANTSVASIAGIKISPSVVASSVTSKTSVKVKISIPVTPSQVVAASTAGTRTTIGQTSSVIVSSPEGTTAVKISNSPGGVTAKANNEGTSVLGITSVSHVSSAIGNIGILSNVSAKTIAASHIGVAGETKIDVDLIRHYGLSSRLEG